MVDNLLDADLRGVYSHGMSFLGFLVGRVQKGGVNPRPQVRVVSDRGAVLLLDADRGPGQVASHQAMSLACSRARETGVAVAGVFRSNHFGTAGYYARMAADQGLIGLAVSNTGACMAPWGGSTPTYGTNPLAIAVPTGGEFPVMIDIALSRAAWGKIMLTLTRGDPIPGNWVLDRKGVPTTDPKEVPQGMPTPLGNHKGYGPGGDGGHPERRVDRSSLRPLHHAPSPRGGAPGYGPLFPGPVGGAFHGAGTIFGPSPGLREPVEVVGAGAGIRRGSGSGGPGTGGWSGRVSAMESVWKRPPGKCWSASRRNWECPVQSASKLSITRPSGRVLRNSATTLVSRSQPITTRPHGPDSVPPQRRDPSGSTGIPTTIRGGSPTQLGHGVVRSRPPGR